MDEKILYGSIIVLILLIVVLILLYLLSQRKQAQETKALKEFVKEELGRHQNSFYQNTLAMNQSISDVKSSLNKDLLGFQGELQKEFSQLHDRTTDRLSVFEKSVAHNLQDSYRSTAEVFQKINERMVRIDETQKGLQDLSKDIVSLQTILQDKKTRGIFGELELYSLLESAFGQDPKRWAKQFKLSNGNIADAVLFGGENLGIIVIDSKFPLENYRRIYDESLALKDREDARKLFKKDVTKHIDDIHNKYILSGETAEVAYMFIPAEAIFAEIYGHFTEVVDYSYRQKVYLVSPTTLMAYLTAIRSIYLGQKKDERAEEIRALLIELSVEFKRFRERNEKLFNDYRKIAVDFEQLKTTGDKIEKRFQRINDVNWDQLNEGNRHEDEE